MDRQDFIKKVKRIVVKVGTSIITTDSGKLDETKISNIVNQVATLHKKGYEVLLVSSGAIAGGVEALGLKSIPKAIPELQASASVGQGLLIHKYSELFKNEQVIVGQVLITKFDIGRQQYLNARNTLNTLLKMKTLPVINENDTIAIDEIKFGDNDTLAALVANMCDADLLIILSDVDGLYTADPKQDTGVKKIDEVKDITSEIKQSAGGAGTSFGKGGMSTKIVASMIATTSQTAVILANGHKDDVLENIINGQNEGTYFLPKKKKLSARKRWILGQDSKGAILIDEGAQKALINRQKSLLAVGISALGKSRFEAGDVVNIQADGQVFAKGISNFSAEELNKIKGKTSTEIDKILDEDFSEEVVHRDDLVIL